MSLRRWLYGALVFGTVAAVLATRPKRPKARPTRKLRPVTTRPPYRFWRSLVCRHEPARYVLGAEVCKHCGKAMGNVLGSVPVVREGLSYEARRGRA